MIQHSVRRLAIVFAVGVVTGCAATHNVIAPHAERMSRVEVAALLNAYPLADGQNIRVVELWRDTALSCHIVQVRDREAAHLHTAHDLTVSVLLGTGEIFIRGTPYPMQAGDVAIVPRGTPHYFVNRSAAPAAAFVTFTPAYDGADQVPVIP